MEPVFIPQCNNAEKPILKLSRTVSLFTTCNKVQSILLNTKPVALNTRSCRVQLVDSPVSRIVQSSHQIRIIKADWALHKVVIYLLNNRDQDSVSHTNKTHPSLLFVLHLLTNLRTHILS